MYTALWIINALQIFMGALDTKAALDSGYAFVDTDIDVFMKAHLKGAGVVKKANKFAQNIVKAA